MCGSDDMWAEYECGAGGLVVLFEAAHCARSFRITFTICDIVYKCNHIRTLLKTVSAVKTSSTSDIRSETSAKTNISEFDVCWTVHHCDS